MRSRTHTRASEVPRGRRFATQQLNLAYAVLLSSQFQGFCRDLHSECVEHVVQAALPVGVQAILRTQLIRGRKLDQGNPNPGNIGSDFDRFGLTFWPEVRARHLINERRQELLTELNEWRNAIAHQDFDPGRLGGTTTLHLTTVRQWRSSINHLAVAFDGVMRSHLEALVGAVPWAS